MSSPASALLETPLAAPLSGTTRARPRLTIRGRRGWIGLNLRELWRSRELLLSLTARDLKLRYKQTALGVIWVILQPLVAAMIFAFVFGRLANLPAPRTAGGEPLPYFVFAFSGMVAWSYFLATVSKLSGVLVANSALVGKVYFPRMLLPLSSATGLLVDFAVAAGMLLVLQMWFGVGLTAQWLLMPVMFAMLLALTLGIGMGAAALCVPYRDVAYILPVALQFLFFASPIGYSGEVGAAYSPWFYLNPIAGLLDAWRWSVLSTPFPPMWAFWYAAGVSVGVLLMGTFVFKRMERTFADVI